MKVSTVLACAFPLLVATAIYFLVPVAVPAIPVHSRRYDPRPETAPLTRKQHLALNAPYLLASFALTIPLGLIQQALFHVRDHDSSAFSHRMTDDTLYAFLPAVFLGLLAAFPLSVRVMVWYFTSAMPLILDRPDRSCVRESLRQSLRLFPRLLWTTAALLTAMNFLAFNAFVQLHAGELRYNAFFGCRTYQYRIADIRELTVHLRRVTPIGTTVNRPWVEIQLANGVTVDTYYLIEPKQIPLLIAAIEVDPNFRGRVRRSGDVDLPLACLAPPLQDLIDGRGIKDQGP